MKFDNRTTELIAIGASVAANCQSCVGYHVGKAAEFGVDQQEVAQAIEIGRMVRRGAAGKVDQVADGLLHKEPASVAGGATAARANEGGCCASTSREAAGGEADRASTPVPGGCAPFSSMAAAWSSGGFPSCARPEGKS